MLTEHQIIAALARAFPHRPELTQLDLGDDTTLLAGAFPLTALAEATSLVTLTTFALANLALVLVKRRDPRPAGVKVYPIWVPVLGFVATAGLFVVHFALGLQG